MENLISIPLNLPNVKVISTETDKEGDFIITVESTTNGTHCHKCGQYTNDYYDKGRIRKLRHLPILGQNTYIYIFPKRYKCSHCGSITTQTTEWYEHRYPHTVLYENHVLLQLVNSTIEDVAIKESLGYEAVQGIVDRYVNCDIDWQTIKSLELVGIDEISARKGHKNFLTIITAKINGKIQILAVLKDNKKETVKEFLSSIPGRLRKTIKVVCTDMYDGFINAAFEFSKKC